jgi:hypothetical protein
MIRLSFMLFRRDAEETSIPRYQERGLVTGIASAEAKEITREAILGEMELALTPMLPR